MITLCVSGKLFQLDSRVMEVLCRVLKLVWLPVLLPGGLALLWTCGLLGCVAFKVSLAGLVTLFVVFPLIFMNSLTIRKAFVFLDFVQFPPREVLAHPERQGMVATRNFFISGFSNVNQKNVTLGTWHVLPHSLKDKVTLESGELMNPATLTEIFESSLASANKPIIIYVHGNANNRACSHRIELYKELQQLDYHIITFDYRSYGDSSPVELTELGLVEDTITVYKWVLHRARGGGATAPPIFLWGHSLGTGVCTRVMALLTAAEGNVSQAALPAILPAGVILESPYNNLYEELQGHFLGKIYSWTPWFLWSIVNPVVDSGFQFKSDEYIGKFSAPVLILHAKDDKVVPYELGVKLMQAAHKARPHSASKVELVLFEEKHNYGHKYICRSPKFDTFIGNFVNKSYKAVEEKEDEVSTFTLY